MSETTERSYYLVESMYFEKLLRTHFMLIQSTLLFEHLLSHSDRPMFLCPQGLRGIGYGSPPARTMS